MIARGVTPADGSGAGLPALSVMLLPMLPS